MRSSTIILGAGLTGLGAAKQIPGSVIYEAKDHPGGHVYSHEQGGVSFDEGAHICHAKDEAWLALLYENAGEVVRMNQSQVGNYWHGQWLTYPVQNHLRDLPPDLRIRALSEIVSAQMTSRDTAPRNYEEWCRGQYGDFLTDQFYREYTDKYWRVSMAEMDVDWLAGRLLPSQIDRIVHGAIAPQDEKQSVFSTFHYPAQGGFFAFFREMYKDVDIHLNRRLVEVDPAKKRVSFADGSATGYERLISTIPLNDLVRAIKNAPSEILRDAASLRHTQLLGVNMIVNKPDLSPYHWFYIYDSEIDISRVKVMSNLIPDSVPPGTTVLQTEIFRRDDEAFDVPAMKKQAVKDMARLLGFDPDQNVAMVDHVVVSHAYPIPTLGRQEAVDRILAWLQSLGIESIGLYGRWKYCWSDQAFAAGKAGGEVGGRRSEDRGRKK